MVELQDASCVLSIPNAFSPSLWEPTCQISYNPPMFRTPEFLRLGLVAGLLMALAGCSSPAQKAITQLGGSPKEAKEAEADLMVMDPKPIDEISDRLQSETDTKVITGAAIILGKIAGQTKNPRAVEGLVNCLKSERADTKAACAEGINQIKDIQSSILASAFKALHKLTLDPDPMVRDKAQSVLGEKVNVIAVDAQELAEDGDFDGAIEKLQQALDFYPSSGSLIDLIAQAYDGKGDTEKAQTYRESMSTVKKFHVLAPLEGRDIQHLRDKVDPSWNKPSDEQIAGKDGNLVGWQDMDVTDPLGYLSLTDNFGVPQACAMFYVDLKIPPGSFEHVLSFRMKERARVWVNDAELYFSKENLSGNWDEVRVPVTFRPKGNNIKVLLCQDAGDWGFAMRILTHEGSPVDGIEAQ